MFQVVEGLGSCRWNRRTQRSALFSRSKFEGLSFQDCHRLGATRPHRYY